MRLPLLFLIILFLACNSENHSPKTNPPNILFILTDDQGWGDLSINGNTDMETPNIDALAQNGAQFDRFFVSAVCSPTRAEILTGRYSVRGGVYATSRGGERLDLDETTIADVFKQAGYATGAFGKWHNGMQYPYHPNGRGFDEYYGFASGHWGHYFSPMLEHNGKLVKGNGFVIDDFTDQTIKFIEQHKDQPFFAYLPYNTPHSPMQVPDKWWDKYKDRDLKMRHREPEKEDELHKKAALAMVENIDWNVGRLVSKLQELGLEENTIILYLSDNGPNGSRWNDGMKGRKGSVDEGGVRSPLIMQWKSHIPAGKMISQIGHAPDFLPTLADLAGIDLNPQKSLDGKSLEPLLMDESPEWEDRIIVNHWRGRTSVRSQTHRLGNAGMLFDMINDPGQHKDIGAETPEVLAELQAVKQDFTANILSELPEEDLRTFPLGHPDFLFTQVPARDALTTGDIQRSNRYPNCSFFSNWTSKEEKIYWPVEVMEAGEFEVTIYYTCSKENVGSTFELSFQDASIQGKITEAHDPPLVGMDEDRSPRIESYVKDFKPMKLGKINLPKGQGELALKALNISNKEVMDFRLLMFERLGE